ncbi:hypothetical protein ACIQV1_03890 [Streptomyces rubiginosohelvolus]|uniref:hypothetical protein n=1 Tax=Streptomyces rubiginosohelvolus TaxID=67362 RepID=UPI003802CE89
MSWDNLSLVILAAFGCLTLFLTQVSEVLSKLPQIIRAWRQVQDELRNEAVRDAQEATPEGDSRSSESTPEVARLSQAPHRCDTQTEPSSQRVGE